MVTLDDLQPGEGSRKGKKRIGRGTGSGMGKTSCRGHKGQRARAGGKGSRGFEGGQMPLQRRLPKFGFTNIFAKRFAVVNLRDLERFEAGTVVDPELLVKSGLVAKAYDGIKLLGHGELTHPLTVKVHRTSNSAKEKIEAMGGKIEVI